MNILHVTPTMDPKTGGVCQAVRTMIKGLAEIEAYNEVVSLDSPDAIFLKEVNFNIHALGPGKGPWSYSRAFIPWLVQNYSRFDVIILHGLWSYHGFAVKKALQLFNKGNAKNAVPKFFIMPHGMLDPYFQRAPDRKLKALRNYVYWHFIESKVFNEASGVLFTCAEELRLARQPFKPYNPKQEIVVGLGVENPPAYTSAMHSAFLDKCPNINGQSFILFLSRIHPKKGVDLLVEAYARLLQKYQGADLKSTLSKATDKEIGYPKAPFPKLVIAGPELDTPYGKKMLKKVSESQVLRSWVLFPGMLTGDAKWGAFYSCDALVLPSHQENFGIAVVEAMACKKPVLISNQVNIWGEIEASRGGFVANDTLEGTQELLERWHSLSFEERGVMGQKASDAFKNSFSKGPAAIRLLKEIKNAESIKPVKFIGR